MSDVLKIDVVTLFPQMLNGFLQESMMKRATEAGLAILPVTGVTLPFLSFGGSSMVVTLGAMGVLMNVARQGH